MTKPKQHGGPRKGAGRKKTAGRVAVTRSVSMRLASWDKLDEMRGEQSRGKYIATNLNLNEWIKQLEAELESSCSAEHLRQERGARKRVEAELAEIKRDYHQPELCNERIMGLEAEVCRLTKDLADWDYGTRAKREQEARQKSETQNAKLRGLLERAIRFGKGNTDLLGIIPQVEKELEALTGELAPTGTVAYFATVQRWKNGGEDQIRAELEGIK